FYFYFLISLGAAYDRNNILLAVVLNMIPVYAVLKLASPLGKRLGNTGILVLEKMFGIILLAIAVKLFSGNISFLLNLK
ncbi:MAG: MarC family protein, partial [Flavobacteriales bacterium]